MCRTRGAMPSMDGVKLPALPITGDATSKLTKSHTTFMGLSRMGKRENNDLPENPAGDAPVEDDADDASNLEVDPVPSVPMQISRLAHIL